LFDELALGIQESNINGLIGTVDANKEMVFHKVG